MRLTFNSPGGKMNRECYESMEAVDSDGGEWRTVLFRLEEKEPELWLNFRN